MDSSNVEDEWQYFLDHQKPVIPILLEPAKIHFQLNRIQYIDFLNQDFDTALRQLHAELARQGVVLKPLSPDPQAGMPPVMAASAASFEAQPMIVPTGESSSQVMRLVIGIAAILLIIAVIAGVLASDLFSGDDDTDTVTPTRDNLAEFAVAGRGEGLLAAMRDGNSEAAAELVCPEFDVAADDFWNAGDLQNIACRAGGVSAEIDCTFQLENIEYKRTFTLDEDERICTVGFNEVLALQTEDILTRGTAFIRAVQFANESMMNRLACPTYSAELLRSSPIRYEPLQNVFCHEGESDDVIGCSFNRVANGTTYYVTLIRGEGSESALFCGDEGIADEQGNPLSPG